MPLDEQTQAAIQQSHEDLFERTLWLQSRCDALEGTLAYLAGHLHLNVQELQQTFQKAQHQCYSERLLQLPSSLAARLDRRQKHAEDLSETPLLKFDPPKDS